MLCRNVLQVMSVVGLGASLAGCGALGGGAESADTPAAAEATETGDLGCGPGADEIATLASSVGRTETPGTEPEPFEVIGGIQSIDADSIVIDDGTGTATLTTLFGDGFESVTAGEGDCVTATGFPVPPAEDSTTDIRFLVDELGPAEE